MDRVIDKWPQIIEHLKIEHELSNTSYEAWIKPLKVNRVVDDTIYVTVSATSKDYVEKKFFLPLKVCIADILEKEYELVFTTEEVKTDNTPISHILNDDVIQKNKTKSLAEKAGLNPKYTFDTFVVGKNNNFAYSSSLAVAESPGKAYNPLFLYGGVGLGKTHLMHSVGHMVLENNPDAQVLYVTSEAFTNDVIESIRTNTMSKLRDKYRYIDVLLIDDIQFIIGKTSTQEEFFHTFCALHDAGKQVIVSSDKPPKEIETLESRLKSRFEWGLIADIGTPDYETRIAILQKRIELEHLEHYKISAEVLAYIATNIKNNIRELEGSLNKLIALYKLDNKRTEIDISLAAEAIKDFISPDDRRQVTPELILDIVSEHFNVSIEDLKSKKRNAEIANARQIAMYLIRTLTDSTLETIGFLLGGKDHTTIKYGSEKIQNDMKNDELLANNIDILLKKINPT
ncbi:MAG TPA: chromosomal replication initiator protein DnaA [Candidatus Dorea intestinavium]|nr:chromosomal replication initiator protein DnaA [Candidatus Dorea intestinavium]